MLRSLAAVQRLIAPSRETTPTDAFSGAPLWDSSDAFWIRAQSLSPPSDESR
ncbi:MAG: hypothetical protein ACKOCM_09255 [Cyanobacteriota bacterium]